MPSFRHSLVASDNRPLNPDVVREICTDVTRPSNLFVSNSLTVHRGYCPGEVVYWEIDRGRLLEETQARHRHQFETWGLFLVEANQEPPTEPLLAIRFAADESAVFVTRGLLLRRHEPRHDGGRVIETQEVVRWHRELVGTVGLNQFRQAGPLRDELACMLFFAVVGLSRLPLTSIESPLPGYSLGRLGYTYRPAGSPPIELGRGVIQLAGRAELSEAERVKLLELAIRATPPKELPDLAAACGQWPGTDTLRAVFNSVSLSPYTDFAPKVLVLLRELVLQAVIDETDRVDFMTHLVHQLARHLAAYDLVTFHHRGANYPDALLLDELVRELLSVGAKQPELFVGDERPSRLRRRAIRHGLLLRLAYADHPVPDLPTSPGENQRVLPVPFERVPEEQIDSPSCRTRRLFVGEFEPDPAFARAVFADLDDPAELRELATALFLERPFGFDKAPGEPDQTLLASHLLFSREIALQRLALLRARPNWLPTADSPARWHSRLLEMQVDGLPLPKPHAPARPGVVSLADAERVAGDWIMLRTTRKTVAELERQYDLRPLDTFKLPLREWRLLAPGSAPGHLRIFDKDLQLRAELAADVAGGYIARGGVEMPAAGLRVREYGSENGGEQPTTADNRLHPAV
jgi:hypothetical protein